MKLSEYLNENGISQRFLSSKIGYTPQYLNMILNGHKIPSKKFMKAVNNYIESTQKYAQGNPVHLDWEIPKGQSKQSDDQS